MSRYLPINLPFFIEHPNQWRALVYRIYINIFSIFLGIKMLPLAISFKDITFYRKGDDIFWSFENKRWYSIGCNGEFKTLKDIDNFWNRYYDAVSQVSVDRVDFT